MTDVEERPFMRAQLSDFSLVVLHHAVVLLLLTHSCGGQSQATGPPQPIVAMIGDDIILPCHLRSSGNPLDVTVEWTRPDLEPKFVHLRRDKGDLLDEQNPSYTGRTSLSDNRLKCGDLSLKLSSVSLSDAGTYQCLVPGSTTESMVELVVGSVSSPKIAISKVSNGVLLDCESKGWYPEPEASWLDSKGKLLSTGTSETVKGPDQLYTVSSRVTVEKQHSSRFTCRVQQKTINQTTEAQIHVRDDFFNTQSTTAVRITISLVACFMCLLTVALVAWRIKKTEMCQGKTETDKKTTRSKNLELQFLMAEHEAKEHFKTSREKMKYLDTAMEKLDEEKKRSEEELKHVDGVISMLKKQKNYLEKQKDTIKSSLEVMRKWKEEGEKNLDGKFVMDRKKKTENVKHLEERIKDQKAQLANTDQLLTDTDEMMMRMTERKGKLQREREQIEKDMKKTEKQREEVREAEKAEKEGEEGGEREGKKEELRGYSEGLQSGKGKREGEETEKDMKKTEMKREDVREAEGGGASGGEREGMKDGREDVQRDFSQGKEGQKENKYRKT